MFLLVRWTVFGEWMTSGLDGTVDSGAEGSTLFCQSCLAGWRHRLHLLDILSLKDGLFGGGGDLVSSSDRPLPVSGTSSKSKGVPFWATVAGAVAAPLHMWSGMWATVQRPWHAVMRIMGVHPTYLISQHMRLVQPQKAARRALTKRIPIA